MILFATDPADTALLLQTFKSGTFVWLLWSPLVFLVAPMLLTGSKIRNIAWIIAGVGALPTVLLLGYSFVDPDALLIAGARATTFTTLCLVLVFVAFPTTVALLAYEAFTTPAPYRRAQLALMATALALEGSYHVVQNAAKIFVGRDFHGLAAMDTGTSVLTLIALAAFLGVAGYAGHTAFRSADPQTRHWARVLMTSILVAGATGGITAGFISGEEFRHPSGLFHALWDLVGLSLLVFAGLRYQLFDIEMRARQAVTVGSILVIGFVTFGVTENFAENFFQQTYFGALPASGSIAALFVAAMSAVFIKVGKGIAHKVFPNVTRSVDYEHRRQEELYSAALEGAFLDGIVSPAEANSIKRLREKLGITLDQHARIEARVRAQMAASAPPPPAAAPA